ncbi:MAG: T9SS type A sorting domain-containing protein [Flavobacteriales bacterium]|jgi:hypothetical protein|nr:T9SS type A sorting domain-containing protein [Flavobacteriales bacterium]
MVTDYTNNACFTSEEVDLSDCLIIGMADIEETDIILYPNPADQSITLRISEFDLKQGYGISMFDVLGQKITEQQLHDGENQMTLSLVGLSSGIYFIRIADEAGKYMQVLRFVKE